MSKIVHGRDHFRSDRYHDAYCLSCRSIMELDGKKIDAIIDANSGSLEDPRKVLRQIQIILECRRCLWQANQGRFEPIELHLIRQYVEEWIVASHLHWMRHNFWDRLPFKSKFATKAVWQEHSKISKIKKLFDNLSAYWNSEKKN